jgi:quercetin dioxygenase-like cupin family protein
MHDAGGVGGGGQRMTPTKALISALVVAGAASLALIAENRAEAPGAIKAEEVLVADLAGEPGKEANIRVYSFPPGASVPWHIHPDTHEFGYQLDGELMLLINGQPSRVLKAGDAFYVPPNVIHRGLTVSRTQTAKFMVVRVKPKGAPALVEMKP